MTIRKLSKVSGIAVLVVALVMGFMGLPGADAATDEQIESAITEGLTWLADQQQPIDGSWQYNQALPMAAPATTGLALFAFLDRARDLGVDPFQTDPENPEYFEYAENVILGFDYLFRIWLSEDGNGIHSPLLVVYNGPDVYTTGIIMLAIAASDAPDREVDTGPLSGLTYQQVLQGMLDWMVFAQNKNGCAIGGWTYLAAELDQPQTDNSNSGYASLGMGLAAAAPPDGFGLQIPESVLDNLDQFIDNIQVDNGEYAGGSIFDPCPPFFPWLPDPEPWINILKAGNLLYEIALVGDSITADRVQAALGFIEKYWDMWAGTDDGKGWKGDYQAMFTLMKGLQAYGIKTLTIDVNDIDQEIDWFYDEFYGVASYIVGRQDSNGSWTHTLGENTPTTIDTTWALLVLQRAVPKVPTFEFQISDQCVAYGQPLESFEPDDAIVRGTEPYTWTWSGNMDLTVAKSTENVFTITYPDGWIGSEAITFAVTDAKEKAHQNSATFTVDPVAIIRDIPDQTTPFVSFDLDDYIDDPVPFDVSWSYAGNNCLTVSIDADNVVTVADLYESCIDPETITFSATTPICSAEFSANKNLITEFTANANAITEFSASKDVTFTPALKNEPPDCSDAKPSRRFLWSPNHKFRGIRVKGVTDPDGDDVAITIDSIFQDEPVDTYGDGKYTPDGRGVGTSKAWVRAERASGSWWNSWWSWPWKRSHGKKKMKSKGNGRVYHIDFTADDGTGDTCSGKVLVGVPLNKGKSWYKGKRRYKAKRQQFPVDDGALYDSTVSSKRSDKKKWSHLRKWRHRRRR